MRYLACYDIADDRRRRRLARLLEGHGWRLHESAFVLRLRPAQLHHLQGRLARMLDLEHDHLAMYRLCRRDHADVVHLGLSRWPEDGHAVVV
jgi:CRISPR-associated protein Cas2